MADRFSYIQRTLMLLKQLDAFASFCEQVQIPVNLSKTKVVVFEITGKVTSEKCACRSESLQKPAKYCPS